MSSPEDYMCPNCVTPWKCNGPHIPDPSFVDEFAGIPLPTPCLLPDDDTAVERLAAALDLSMGPERRRRLAANIIAALREGGQG